jgi:hypothetical protein
MRVARLRVVRGRVLVGTVGLFLVGCSKQDPSQSGPTSAGPASASAVTSSSVRPAVSATAIGGPSATASAAPKELPPLAPGTFRCGETACRAGKETCCSDGTTHGCVATVAPGPEDKAQYLATQMMACNALKLENAFQSVVRCEDASDCGKDETCCEEWLFSGAYAMVCKPLRGGAPACGIAEGCRTTCRSKGAECHAGACRKPLDEVRCGAGRCQGDKPACCGETPACHTEAECSASGVGPRYQCASPRDCIDSEHCARSIMGTSCTRLWDVANTETVCDTVKDCPEEGCLVTRAKIRCEGAADGLRTCTCKEAGGGPKR